MNRISKPVEPQILQEIKAIPALDIVRSMLLQSPATIIKVEAAIKEGSTTKAVEGYALVGYKKVGAQPLKTAAAFAGRLKQSSKVYSIRYEGDLKRPSIKARWNKEMILNQHSELIYNGKFVYGPEEILSDDISVLPQGEEKIEVHAKIHKTQAQINAVKQSAEFKKCEEEEHAGRVLSPICSKVRDQAAALDRVEMTVALPNSIYQSQVLSLLEEFTKAAFFANFKQMQPTAHLPIGKVRLDLAFARAGDLADIVVEHRNEAYAFKSIRIPQLARGIMPFAVRNPFDPVGAAVLQKLTNRNAPAKCRVEPSIIRTFDNRTYHYEINECEHVLLTDRQRSLPVAVITRTMSGGQKMVKVLSGKIKVEVIPNSGSLQLKVNGQAQSINPGKTFVAQNATTGEITVQIMHYQDGVYQIYAPLQMMHVITDGKRVEVIAPQVLKNRAIGLCGNMNGEEIADLTTPKRCIMQPKLVAFSYILNKNGNEPKFASCPKAVQHDLAAFQREDQRCVKEEVVKTPILDIFERVKGQTIKLGGKENISILLNSQLVYYENVKLDYLFKSSSFLIVRSYQWRGSFRGWSWSRN